jgi:hypothetical protein
MLTFCLIENIKGVQGHEILVFGIKFRVRLDEGYDNGRVL